MAGEWQITTFAGAVAIQRGHDLPEQARSSGTVPVIGSAGLTGWHNQAIAHGPGIAIGRSGASAGHVTYVREDFWPHNTALYVTDFRGNNPFYIFNLLSTLGLASHAGGSAQPSLNRNHLAQLPIRLPPRDEQDRIAELLGTLDHEVRLNGQMANTLGATAQALFKSWFVDFSPVRAKAKGCRTGLSEALAKKFPDRFTDDGLPDGWRPAPLLDFFDLEGGGTPKTSVPEYWGGGIPWFSVVDTPASGPYVLATERTLTPAGLANCAADLLPENATIITARGTVGKLALVGQAMAINQSCYAAIAKDGWGPLFTYFLIQSGVEGLQAQSHGSVFDTITKATFAGILATKPPHRIATAFESAVSPLLARIKIASEQSRTLVALRDTLLPKLISGKLRIHDAERTVAAA